MHIWNDRGGRKMMRKRPIFCPTVLHKKSSSLSKCVSQKEKRCHESYTWPNLLCVSLEDSLYWLKTKNSLKFFSKEKCELAEFFIDKKMELTSALNHRRFTLLYWSLNAWRDDTLDTHCVPSRRPSVQKLNHIPAPSWLFLKVAINLII